MSQQSCRTYTLAGRRTDSPEAPYWERGLPVAQINADAYLHLRFDEDLGSLVTRP